MAIFKVSFNNAASALVVAQSIAEIDGSTVNKAYVNDPVEEGVRYVIIDADQFYREFTLILDEKQQVIYLELSDSNDEVKKANKRKSRARRPL
jgi:hypothetical protein